MVECDNDREAAEDLINESRLHETIDGHQWVIYYACNNAVRFHSGNDGYAADNFGNEYLGQVLSEQGYESLGTVIAFWCMYADVQDKLSEAFDNYEDNLAT